MCPLGWKHRSRGLLVSCLLWLYLLLPYLSIVPFFCFIALYVVKSKIGLIHKDNVDWFLNLDKTHHTFLAVGTKGGATGGRYINPSFPCSGERCIVSNFHTLLEENKRAGEALTGVGLNGAMIDFVKGKGISRLCQ